MVVFLTAVFPLHLQLAKTSHGNAACVLSSREADLDLKDDEDQPCRIDPLKNRKWNLC